MSVIDSTWRDYFTNPDEGMGTTYERFILHRHFENIRRGFGVQTVLEAPAFGMTGISDINSIWWAQRGSLVTVVDHDRERIDSAKRIWHELGCVANFVFHDDHYATLPFEDAAFDMSWNFAALSYVRDLETFLRELTRVTRKVLFLCVPNTMGLGYLARQVMEKPQSKGMDKRNIDPRLIHSCMDKLRWEKEGEGFFDVPPWPDIAMKKEDFLRKIGAQWLVGKLRKTEDNTLSILEYYQGRKRNMENEMMRFSFLEESPWIVKRFWAHHRYMLFTPR